MNNWMFIILGLFLVIVGCVNISGNISTIHSYQRRNIKEEDVPAYGRWTGAGTLIIGVALLTQAVFVPMGQDEFGTWVMMGALIAGLSMMFYAQFKYNKGLF